MIKKFDNDVKGSRSRQSIHTAVNWDAEAVTFSLHLVADSIRNVATYLGVFSGLKELHFWLPQPEAFEVASKRVGLQSMSMPMATPSAAPTITKEQLMIEIKKASAKRLVRSLNDVVRSRQEADASASGR